MALALAFSLTVSNAMTAEQHRPLPHAARPAGGQGSGFDRELWLRSGTAFRSPRAYMVAGLLASRLKPGMGRDEVEALLGPPERVTAGGAYRYHLGIDPLGVDPQELEISFDGRGRLVQGRVVGH